MRKYLAPLLVIFFFALATPAFSQDSSRLADLNEDVATRSRKEARAQKKVEKQERKLERKRKKLERRQNKTDRRERKRNREERKLEKRDSTAPAPIALCIRKELDDMIDAKRA